MLFVSYHLLDIIPSAEMKKIAQDIGARSLKN